MTSAPISDIRHRRRSALRRRCVGATDERVRVFVPHIVLRLFGEARDQPLMRGEQARIPRRSRRRMLPKLNIDIDQHVEVLLEPAEKSRLDEVEIADGAGARRCWLWERDRPSPSRVRALRSPDEREQAETSAPQGQGATQLRARRNPSSVLQRPFRPPGYS